MGTTSRARRVCVSLGATVLALALVVTGSAPHQADAHSGLCRTDPIIQMSDGQQMHIAVVIGDEASDVQSISYVVHAPAGTAIDGVRYTGGELGAEEAVTLTDDQPPGHYSTVTNVTTGGSPVAVTASTVLTGSGRESVSGYSGQDLTASF